MRCKKISAAKKILIFALCLAAFSACRKNRLEVKKIQIEKSSGGISEVMAEVARTESERNHGFMERKKIPDGTGMIFVFERDEILSFWMKNTPHPLSIAYIDRNGIIRDILDMTPFSLSSVKSSRSVRFALEVPQGWFAKEGISAGDKVILNDFFD
jgi:hypothetical protein